MSQRNPASDRPVVFITYLAEMEWAGRVATSLRAHGYSSHAWVLDSTEVDAVRDLGCFDAVFSMSAHFDRCDAVGDVTLLGRARMLEDRLGLSLRKLAAIDRHLTGTDHIDIPPIRIRRRWTWLEVCALALHLEAFVLAAVDTHAPQAIVGELGGLVNRLVSQVARAAGIPVLGQVAIPYHSDRIAFTDRLDGEWPACVALYRTFVEGGIPSDSRVAADRVLSQIRGRSTLAIPRSELKYYIPTLRARVGPSRIANVLGQWRATRRPELRSSPRLPYEELVTPGARLRRKYRRYRTRRQFEAVAASDLPEAPYVTYFLHSQPEIGVEGWSFDFQDQISVVRSIAACVPADVTFLVKEHRWQAGVRDPSFYGELLSIPGITLVGPEVSTADVLAGTGAAISLTGTVTLEAMCLKVPAIVFGSVYYQHFKGIKKFSDYADLADCLHNLDGFPTASDHEIAAALAARHAASMPGSWLSAGHGQGDEVATAAAIRAAIAAS